MSHIESTSPSNSLTQCQETWGCPPQLPVLVTIRARILAKVQVRAEYDTRSSVSSSVRIDIVVEVDKHARLDDEQWRK